MSIFKRNAEKKTVVTKDLSYDNQVKIVEKHQPRKESKMSDDTITKITQDVEINGTIKFDKALRIDGKFEGEMITDQGEVFVGKTGGIKANVKVKNATIEGRVDGNIIATERVELKHKAQLLGDLKARTLVIEEGVVFVGKCDVNPDGFKMEAADPREGKRDAVKDEDRLVKSVK
ncbi:MAG: polymer-forming cytoskeletal protein [Planctomycetes bacterium]|nr:polymer-forming cytoskeletal protein [Planctomycetota bacterium]